MGAHDASSELNGWEWPTICLKLLSGDAGSTRQGAQFRSRAGPVQCCTENGEVLRGQCVKERLEEHLRLTKAGIEVVVERIELFPTRGGLNGQPLSNIVGVLFKLHPEMLDGVREDAKFMEKA